MCYCEMKSELNFSYTSSCIFSTKHLHKSQDIVKLIYMQFIILMNHKSYRESDKWERSPVGRRLEVAGRSSGTEADYRGGAADQARIEEDQHKVNMEQPGGVILTV